MYTVNAEKFEAEEGILICSISDDSGAIIRFASDLDSATEFAKLLNDLSVERCHVPEIAEDIFMLVN